MTVKSYKLDNLDKVTEEEMKYISYAYELIPATSVREKLDVELRKVLLKHLGEKSIFYLDSVRTDTMNSFLGNLAEGPILCVIGTDVSKDKILLHIDNNLAFLLINRLLDGGVQGSSQDASFENKPMAETEQGILQYMIMKVLAVIWKTCGEAGRMHFRFERFIFEARSAASIFPSAGKTVNFSFKAGIGDLSGFVKIVFPKDFLEKNFGIVKDAKSQMEMDYLRSELIRFNFIQSTLWAEGGKASISYGDLIALEEGDVVLFDETSLTLKEGRLYGEADLRIGNGGAGGLRASVEAKGSKIKCTIVGG